MHAHAVALRFPRGPVQRSPQRAAPAPRQIAMAMRAAQYQASLRVFVPHWGNFSAARSAVLLSGSAAAPWVSAAVETSRAAAQTTQKIWLVAKPGLKFIAA